MMAMERPPAGPPRWKPSEFRWCRDMQRPHVAHFANINRYRHEVGDLTWIYSVCEWSVVPDEPEKPGETERCPTCMDWARAHGHLDEHDRPTSQTDDKPMSWKRTRGQAEDEVLEAAGKLDPNDQSERAQQIRETAEDIQDHRDSRGRSSG